MIGTRYVETKEVDRHSPRMPSKEELSDPKCQVEESLIHTYLRYTHCSMHYCLSF